MTKNKSQIRMSKAEGRPKAEGRIGRPPACPRGLLGGDFGNAVEVAHHPVCVSKTPGWKTGRKCPTDVAQIFNLLYRRIAFGKTVETPTIVELKNASQIANLRNSRMQFCATGCGAGRS